MVPTPSLRAGAALCALVPLALASHAQTLVANDLAGGIVVETTGPPAPPCGYPTGPVVGGFPVPQPFACPVPGPPLAPLGGDVAVDRVTDTTWVTDGALIAGYGPPPLGAIFSSYLALGFPVPGPITGMGFDGAAGILWITDGVLVAGIAPPAPGCPLPPAVLVAPFPIAPPGGLATDIDWDPTTASLFVCDAGGFVSNWLPGGAPGPFAPFAVAFCPLAPLVGLAVDAGASAVLPIPVLWVTDGATIAYTDALGAPAPATFYSTVACQPTAAPLNGLAATARPIAYGFGGDTTGAPAPVLGAVAQAITPSPGFALTVAGSIPGSVAVFAASLGALCPPFLLYGALPIQITPAPLFLLGAAPVGAGGAAILPAPIALPFGATFFVQAFVLTPVPGRQITNALEFTVSPP